MSLTSNIVINIFSVTILSIVLFHALKSTEKNLLQQKLFISMVMITEVMLVTDVLSRFDGNPGTLYAAVNQIGNLLIFLVSPVLPSIWLLYIHSQVNHAEDKTERWLYFIYALNFINAILVILTQFFGWYYVIDADNIYHRGPLFWFPVAVTMTLATVSFILIISHRDKIDRKYFLSLALFPVPPIICVLMQVAFYGMSLILNGAAISLLIVFITIQNQSMNTDFLTQAYNRKGLEIYLRQKITASTDAKTFSAILLDLDNFKMINDTFGHNTGDRVLETTVTILKGCLGSNGFVARFGGDEFVIILNITSREELEKTADKIRDCFKTHLEQSDKPFMLSFSMGYAVYDYSTHQSAQEFQHHLDAIMYQNKRAKKTAGNTENENFLSSYA